MEEYNNGNSLTVLPNTQIPYIGEYIKFVSALYNRYRRPLNTGSTEEDQILGTKMLFLSKKKNELMDRVISESLDKRSGRWVKLDALEVAPDFPKLSEDDIRDITLGVYQLKLAKSYTDEHLDGKAQYEVLQQGKQLIRVRMDSDHISSNTHNLWITYEEASITSWYCKCRPGARVVGTYSQISSVIRFLGFQRYQTTSSIAGKSWIDYVQDTSQHEAIDESDTDPEE